MKITYSGLWPEKNEAPVGNPDGYYQKQKPKKKPVKPVQKQTKRKILVNAIMRFMQVLNPLRSG